MPSTQSFHPPDDDGAQHHARLLHPRACRDRHARRNSRCRRCFGAVLHDLRIRLRREWGEQPRHLAKRLPHEDGSTANRIPFALHNSRAQQIFLASEIKGPRVFTQLCLRLDERYIARGGTQQIEVRLGETSKTDKTLSSSFAANYSTRPVTVFRGALKTPSHDGKGTLSSWGICIDFTTKYIYGGGNLIVEIIESSDTSMAHFADACFGDAGSTTARVYAHDKDATSGIVEQARGLIMRLCGEGGGIPTLAHVGVPALGKSFDVTLSGAKPNVAALLFLGARIDFGMAPFAPGCSRRGWQGLRDGARAEHSDASRLQLLEPVVHPRRREPLGLRLLKRRRGHHRLGLE